MLHLDKIHPQYLPQNPLERFVLVIRLLGNKPHLKKSAEVLMPAISGCKDCHAGTVPVAQRVSSDCGVCHNFHMNPDQQAVQKKSHPIPKQSSIQSSSYLFSSIGKSK